MAEPKLFSALEVAHYFLDFANEMGRSVNLVKLQYLVYYAQAWHLAMHDRALFADAIYADASRPVISPVIMALREAYAGFGGDVIVAAVQVNFSPEMAAYLHAIVREYFDLEVTELAQSLTSEAPWQQAMQAASQGTDELIPIATDWLRDYYQMQLVDD
jgi:uncharacterized phage-associated protein